MAHPWDLPGPGVPAAPAGTHPWDEEVSLEGQTSDDTGDEPASAATAGQDFVEYMISLLLRRALNAREFCEAMYLAGKAGVAEAVPFGFRLDAPSGHYQRHLQATLPVYANERLEELYEFSVPAADGDSLGPTTHQMTGKPLHEVVARGADGDEEMRTALVNAVSSRQLPPAYFENPVVREHGDVQSPVVPLAIFADGVPYSHLDSVVGFWAMNIITGGRVLFCVVRKKLACPCGCRGWCTMHAVFAWIRWSVECLARGVYPSRRHTGHPFEANDSMRAALAGAQMGLKAIVLWVKGDWAEYATTFGFAGWRDALRPCFLCNAFGTGLQESIGIGLESSPWLRNEQGDYNQACSRCEILVTLDARTHRLLTDALAHDRRPSGNRGLCLVRDLPELRLLARDRVEPTADMPSPKEVFHIGEFPAQVLLWRASRETLARHRCPLFWTGGGIDPATSVTVDLLHALYLGTMKDLCRETIWCIILAGVWGGSGTLDEVSNSAVTVARHQLHAFYRKRQATHPYESITRIPRLSLKLIGTNANRQMKTKGAETWGLLLFLHEVLSAPANAARLGMEGRKFSCQSGVHLR